MVILALFGFMNVRRSVRTGDLVRGHMTDQTINRLRLWSKKGLLVQFIRQGIRFDWPRDPETIYIVLDDFCPEIKGNPALNAIPDFLGIRWVKCMSPDGQAAIYDSSMMKIFQKCEVQDDE